MITDIAQNKLEDWSNYHALCMTCSVLTAVLVGSVAPIVFAALLMFSILFVWNHGFLSTLIPYAGVANWLTVGRFIVCSLTLAFFPFMSDLSLFMILSLCVLMDVVDGFVARGLAQTSDFGRIIDMEVDAYFVMIMGLYFYFTTSIGLWLLLPGLLRYGYRIMIWRLALDDFHESKKAYAAWLAGINFILLLVAIIAPNAIATGINSMPTIALQSIILWVSIFTVSFSFSISFYEVFRFAKAR